MEHVAQRIVTEVQRKYPDAWCLFNDEVYDDKDLYIVDVVVFQIGAPEVVADVCDEASFRVVMEMSESIEPLIFYTRQTIQLAEELSTVLAAQKG